MGFSKFQRILLAVDDSPCSHKVLDYAKAMLEGENAALALVTVVPPTSPASYGADPLLGQQPIIVAEVAEIQQQAAQEYLERLASEFTSTQEIFTFTRIGNIREEILTAAHEWAADLLILGTNGRTGFEHFISGSVSESVIRKAECPVLVIPSKCD
ncbi:Nucleotide-binding universal stress protein, UspA family [Sphingobacterium nematocida]|uniref:Universal stress protein n=1 Tax=Sphingobacterium nematocida TaxID=1513896 RepID=A0A1T5E076_9SPHI|nr:universal stress protein [Sphingobacterium nematocida]SKB77418.1 Nucleotide-binding universal stress protein, UspA family [Sphingobacterium nematocida]